MPDTAPSLVVYLDAGHGGIDAMGNYTTAPRKMFRFGRGIFHRGSSIFYEGIQNRVLADDFKALVKERNMPWFLLKVYDEVKDTPLSIRTRAANHHMDTFPKVGKPLFVYISFHCNAANGKARGYEVFTSPGQTRSDVLAALHFEEVGNFLPELRRRPDYVEGGDPDKEDYFTVITRTRMPAILIEHEFFDNIDGARFLLDPTNVRKFSEALLASLTRYVSAYSK